MHEVSSLIAVRARLPSHRKDSAVQSLRGLAVILMVSGHVIGSSTASGDRQGRSRWDRAWLARSAKSRTSA